MKFLCYLKHLDLGGNDSEGSFCLLLAAELQRPVWKLNTSRNQLHDSDGLQRTGSSPLDAVKNVDLALCHLGNEGVRAFLQTSSSVKCFDRGQTGIDMDILPQFPLENTICGKEVPALCDKGELGRHDLQLA